MTLLIAILLVVIAVSLFKTASKFIFWALIIIGIGMAFTTVTGLSLTQLFFASL